MMRPVVRCCAIAWLLAVTVFWTFDAAVGQGTTPKDAKSPARVDDATLLRSVAPLNLESFDGRDGDERTRETLQAYYDSVLDWGRVLRRTFHRVPGHPDWGYYGDGNHQENAVRAVCYAVCINGFLAEIAPPEDRLDPSERDRFRAEAVAAIRYLVQSHQTGGGACLNGHPWGNQWQSAMWARALGMGAWMVWDRLDRPTRLGVARVLEFEADRFITTPPRSGLVNNTGAEENAWNAGMITLASAMMPGHPHAADWDQAAKRYLYNTFSIADDKRDTSPGDDGRRVCDWVTTVNAYPDLTLENHGLVHVGYLKNSHAMMFEAAAPYVLTGREPPKACFHHVQGVTEVLLDCIAWEGTPIYFGGNDWKLVHTQCQDVINFAMAAILLQDARAARVAETALDWLRRIQQERKGYFSVRTDPEHNGMVALRLIFCYLTIAQRGLGVEPVTQAELDKYVTGVRHLAHGQAILHRTPTKFASFAWGSNRMGLALPYDGNWTVWPHFASYTGLVDGRDASRRAGATIVKLNPQVEADRFAATGEIKRLGGRVTQDFAFASLKKDVVVYIERLQAKDGFRPKTRETGVVGHEYPLGENTRTLFGRFGRKQVVALGNARAVHPLESDWLNVGGKVGYVVRRGAGRTNLMRYHDERSGEGRVPQLQEWFSLVGDRKPAPLSGTGDWACVVTFLNQSPEETAQQAEQVRFTVDGDTAVCRMGDDVVTVDFARKTTTIQETSP
ncbi:MAG TPA: hypothetical protein VJL29_07170 [Thermoguttaceae bacterium]|nr:hypothetical protein [Thermoguttaceae bacterium]